MIDGQTRLLFVDDEATIRKFLRGKFSKEGYQCWEAGNANEAMDTLESNPIELVILDIRMPGKSGLELLPEIKALYPDTAVIMATAMDDTGTAVECMKAGAYDFLTKPFNLEDVVLSVGRALDNQRLELENREYQLTIQRQLTALNNLFQAHLDVRQQTEEAYGYLASELARMGDELQILVSQAQIQWKEFQMTPAERVATTS